MPTDPNQKVLEAKVIQWGPGHGVAVTYEGNKVEEYYIGTKEDAKEQVQLLLSGKNGAAALVADMSHGLPAIFGAHLVSGLPYHVCQ
jgi:hypothetical protein